MKYCKAIIILSIMFVASVLYTVTVFHHQASYSLQQVMHSQICSQKRLPDAIVIGVAKCGTGALMTFLGHHPRIAMARHEVHYFSYYFDKGIEWYKEQMEPSTGDQLTMEKTPKYFVYEESPQRIYNMNPAMKLILTVKDPVKRAMSAYTHYAAQGKCDTKSRTFEDTVLSPRGQCEETLLSNGVYHKHYERWASLFPQSQIHVVNGDSLITDAAKEMAKVETFLGISHYVSNRLFYSEQKGFYCMKEINNEVLCMDDKKGRPPPTVQQKVLKKLRKFFEPHNKIFFEMIGRSFNWTGGV